MAKLIPIEQQVIATALLAMYAECPVEARAEIDPVMQSIFVKLALGEALEAVKAAARPEP
jgi:hypothetical protein